MRINIYKALIVYAFKKSGIIQSNFLACFIFKMKLYKTTGTGTIVISYSHRLIGIVGYMN